MEFPVDQLPDTFTVEHDGKQIPLRETSFVKEAPDLPTFVKRAIDAHREVGARVRIPDMKTAKPDDVAAFKTRLYESGILPTPLAKPEDYGIVKPTDLAAGVFWNDELAGEFAKTLHKHGATKEMGVELLAIHNKALLGAQTVLKTSFDEGIAALKREHGDKFDERMEVTKRFTSHIFKTPEEIEFFEKLGLGDHPAFLSVMMRLAPFAQQDSSFMKDIARPGGGMSADDVRGEVAKIMTDKTHPMYEGYWRKDPKVMSHVEELYKKAYGDAKVELSGGITVDSGAR